MTQNWQIRNAEEEDIPQIVELWRELMDCHHRYDDVFCADAAGAARYERWLLFHLQEEASVLLVAHCDNHIIAYGLAYLQDPARVDAPAEALLSDVCVTAAWRSRGIGRALASALEGCFKDMGVRSFEVKTASANLAANRFWLEVMGYGEFMRIHRKVLTE